MIDWLWLIPAFIGGGLAAVVLIIFMLGMWKGTG